MKFFKWIKKVGRKIKEFFIQAEYVTSGAYEKLDETGKTVVPIAVRVVEVLKGFITSPTSDVVIGIITLAIPGTKDDIILSKVKVWLEKELPKLAIKLNIVNTIINLKTPEEKIQAICKALQISGTGADALAFASNLASYLADGKLTKEELEAAIDDYYLKFVKDGNKG